MEVYSWWASTKADSLTKCFNQIQLIPYGPLGLMMPLVICANINSLLLYSTRSLCGTATGARRTGLDLFSLCGFADAADC